MADYHAVLNRTLSGFSDPKPELRSKLYERARATITRQLQGRNPPLSQVAFDTEIGKLEAAITEIEQKYDPAYGAAQAAPHEPAPSEPAPLQEFEAQPAAIVEEATSAADAPQLEPQPEAPLAMPQDVPVPPPALQDPIPELEIPAPPVHVPAPEPVQETQPAVEAPVIEPSTPTTPTPTVSETVAQDPIAEAMTSGPMEPFDPSIFDPNPDLSAEAVFEAQVQETQQPEPHFGPPPEFTPPEPVAEPLVEPIAESVAEPAPAPALEPDPMDQWAQEFLGDPNTDQQVPPAVTPAQEPVAAPVEQVIPEAPVQAAAPAAVAPPPSIPQFDPVFSDTQDDSLTIPPATGFTERRQPRKKRGILKWIVSLLILALLAGAGYFGWQNKDMLSQGLSVPPFLTNLFSSEDDPTKPKPVKTIKITPEPATETESQPPSKSETRLTPDGQEVQGSNEQPVVLPPSSTATGDQTIATTDAQSQTPGALPVAQRALLYEEGTTAAESTIDTGRIIWSVVQEEPGPGEPKEAAIRGRVEIPDRNLVLIMTIKRNADQALPASHLIELVFAVPDNFSGGAIGEINRFVLKDSEQGRGDGLIGVPARIADGIFLIALNNLEDAVKTNESLMQARQWIDIPLQYRTGKRALITIEKGVPGDQVFKDVFAAWNAI